ncbi:MAG TPA: DUF4215 domain-containing protein, partial [Nannocystaceae bacterium]|nr:DUF4215 domain-containing protein [Nannocystaceae bacterium]
GVMPLVCGDGEVGGDEECDDGNADNTDECLDTCVAASCGDANVQAGVEECDDGGRSATCDDDCTAVVCGDGVTNVSAGEACDDGNTDAGDGCSPACALESCGDGEVAGAEECDDGNMVNTDDCTDMCIKAACGDGYVWADNETCDDKGESATCDADCTAVACGDGVMNAKAGEACDDGNMVNTDDCTAACKAPVCGDGFVWAGKEACDDGNMINGDGCENNCTKTPLPPECMNYTALSDAFRHVNNANGPVGCDNPFSQQWYRFMGAAGTMMPTTAPPTYRCGTHAPGWMNGTHPAVNEGAVARTICFNWNNNTCNWSEPAMVRNCGDFYVYFLKNVSWGCNGRYCGTG